MSNLLAFPLLYHAPNIPAQTTTYSLQLDLKTVGVPIPHGATAKVAWIAQMSGAGYAEMIWSINDITPDFRVTLFIRNTTNAAIKAEVTITFIVMLN